jgi:hypothetical protein
MKSPVCPPLITSEPLGKSWYGGNSIQWDLGAIIINPIPSTILKWLRFKVVSWRRDFQPCTAMVWDCLIVGLLWLQHIQSLSNVAVATIACNLLQGKSDIKAVMLPWHPELVVYCRAKAP